MTVLMGLDLSATAAAAMAVPVDWDGSWHAVFTRTLGESLRKEASDDERARRCHAIALGIVAFAKRNDVSEAWIEGYAFMRSGGSNSVHTLAEVCGCVRMELVRAGITLRTSNMSTARKLLLGKLPRKGAKVAAYEALRAAGCPAWTLDESDAFVCANLGLSEHAGAFCFATQPPPVEKKVRKAKT